MGRRDEWPSDACMEEQPQYLRDPMRAVSAFTKMPSSYFEYLVRRGDAIEAAMVRVEKMAHRLYDLLEQSQAAHRSLVDSAPH